MIDDGEAGNRRGDIEDDPRGRTEGSSTEKGANGTLGRRGFLKAAGVGIVSTVGLSATAAADEDYDVIEVNPGSNWSYSLDDGETFENVLFDCTAANTRVSLTATGRNWTIRNVGIKGVHDQSGGHAVLGLSAAGGTDCLVENVWMGDGSSEYGGASGSETAAWVAPDSTGTITFRHCYIANWKDNGIYGSAPGNNGNGAVVIEECYAANNYHADYRIGSTGSVVRDSVVEHTSGGTSGGVRGIWCWYNNGLEVRNCDVDVNGQGAAVHAGPYAPGGVNLYGTQYDGSLVENGQGNGSITLVNNNGRSPDTSIPDGVPRSAEAAASGGSSGSGGGSDGGSSDEPELSDDAHLVAFVSEEGSSNVTYEFTAGGPVEFTEAGYESPSGGAIEGGTWNAMDFVENDGDTWTAGGGTGLGAGDAYLVDGPVLDVTLDSPEEMWIELDGERVTPEELVERTDPESDGGEDGTGEEDFLVAFISEPESSSVTYDFVAEGPVEFTEAGYESPSGGDIEGGTWNAKDFVENDGNTWSAGGGTGLGAGDAYRVSGPIVSVNLDSPEEMWIELDGERVTPEELVERTDPESDGGDDDTEDEGPNLLAFISEEGSSNVTYEFTAGGPVEFTEAGYESPSGGDIEGGTWNAMDFVENDGDTWTAGGGTGLGDGDAYLVDGPVLDVTLDSPEEMWIELDGERVTPEELVE